MPDVGPGRPDADRQPGIRRARPSDPEADEEALTGRGAVIPLRDANPTRRTPRRSRSAIVIACFVGVRLGARPARERRRRRARRLHHRRGASSRPSSSAAWGARRRSCRAETATLVTSQFLHGGWLHLLGNLLYLWIFGNNVEDRLGPAGVPALLPRRRRRSPALAQVAIDPTSTIPTIGASGAIAATLGAYFVLFPRARITSLVFLGLLLPADRRPGGHRARLLVRAPAHRRADLARAWSRASGGVAFFAHIGGFVAGALVARLLVAARLRAGRPPAPAAVG